MKMQCASAVRSFVRVMTTGLVLVVIFVAAPASGGTVPHVVLNPNFHDGALLDTSQIA